jgi:hypothetical protein
MAFCGKIIKPAKNGKDRATCTNFPRHRGQHGSATCAHCGCDLTPKTATKSHLDRGNGKCRHCNLAYSRVQRGGNARNIQHPGKFHVFRTCGCMGTLPKRGDCNQFVTSTSRKFRCRVSAILSSSACAAKNNKYRAIPRKTPHALIRALMQRPNCVICGKLLHWKFGLGKTPPLHHNHETGQPLGFAHIGCNVGAESLEIARLNRLVRDLTAENLRLSSLLQH